MFIVVDGVDGSGKDTFAKKLLEVLREDSYFATMQNFPIRTHPTINAYLQSKKLTTIKTAEEFQKLCREQRERLSGTLNTIYKKHPSKHYIAVRWTPTGICYGTIDKLKHKYREVFVKKKFHDHRVDWVFNKLVKQHEQIVTPDVGIILTCNPEVAIKRITKRGGKLERYENKLILEWLNFLFNKFYMDMSKEYLLFDTTDIGIDDDVILKIIKFQILNGGRDK